MATRFKDNIKTAWGVDLSGKDKKIILSYAASEKEEYHKIIIGKDKIEIMCRRPSVGFEAANHYYFNRQMIMEKIVNCDYLLGMYAL